MPPTIPPALEEAIGCYERWSGLAVAVHDVDGVLPTALPPARAWHVSPWCRAMKEGPHGARCLAWDISTLRATITARPDGVVRCCHAGLVELAVPILRQERLALVLFAGQRTRGQDLAVEEDRVRSPWTRRLRLPPALDAATAAHALEGLRQLAARIALWLEELRRAAPGVPRDEAIRRFVAEHHRQPIQLSDLAAHLGLSVHRTAHVVRERCGSGFVALVTAARLATARQLLRRSDATVASIARASGFADPDHFHRVFRRVQGTTPQRFRRACTEV